MTNPWHSVSLGEKAPDVVTMIVEIPKGSTVKYELDKDSGMLLVDRFLHSAVYYPADYGLLPQTYWEDGDPLDIVLITRTPSYPLALAEVRVIGVMQMVDGGEPDDKIIAVHANDPVFKDKKSLEDIPKHQLAEIKNFFETYKALENKKVSVKGFLGPQKAKEFVLRGRELYKKKFS